MKHFLLPCLLFIICLTKVAAQCSLQPSFKTTNGTLIKSAHFEILYENEGESNNGDLTKGYTKFHSRFTKQLISNASSYTWHIEVATDTNRDTDFVPRRLDFYFTDGTSLTLEANNLVRKEGFKISGFSTSGNDIVSLKKTLQQVDVIDTRAERMYSSTKNFGLYGRVLAEQIACLE